MEKEMHMTEAEFTRRYLGVEEFLYRFALKLTKSEFAAKDLIQDTLLKAYNKKDTFKKSSSFKSWMSTIMFHGFVSAYRKKKRERNYNLEISSLQEIPSNTSISNAGYQKLMHDDIVKHLEVLSPKVKSTFDLHYQGYRYDEISDILAIPTGTVKSRINFVRNKAKSIIV